MLCCREKQHLVALSAIATVSSLGSSIAGLLLEAALLAVASLLESALLLVSTVALVHGVETLALALGEGLALGSGTVGAGDVGGAELAGARVLLDEELDLLTIGEGLVAVHLDGGKVDEIIVAINASDEAKTLLGVEELDGAGLSLGIHDEKVKVFLQILTTRGSV